MYTALTPVQILITLILIGSNWARSFSDSAPGATATANACRAREGISIASHASVDAIKVTGRPGCRSARKYPGLQRDPTDSYPRSFSIAGGANGETWNQYAKAMRYAELENPSRRYVFVEAAATRGALLGSWQMNPKSKTWVDPVAMWHDRKSTLGFADGHAETHAWHDASFINWNLVAMYEPAQFSFGMTPPAQERDGLVEVVDWVLDG